MYMKIILYDRRGQPESVYVFTGRESEVPQEELFRKEQLDDFKEYNTKIIQCPHEIYGDDSIHAVKTKIVKELSKTQAINLNECFLFYADGVSTTPIDFYNQTTNFKKEVLHGYKFGQALFNGGFMEEHTRNIPYKQQYTYDDIVALDIQRLHLFKPLGIEFTDYYDFRYSGNPFQVLQTQPIAFENSDRNALITLDNKLLFNYTTDDTLHMVTADTLLEYCEDNGLNEEYFMRIYFPSLAIQGITSRSLLQSHNRINEEHNNEYHENIELLHKIQRNVVSDMVYEKNGIKHIKFAMYGNRNVSLPLETLFKDVHCDQSIPVIKLNPGKSKENIYRLFTKDTTRQGTRIPFLPKASVIANSKRIDKPHTITFFIHGDDTFYVSIDESADIYAEFIPSHPMPVDTINQTIRTMYANIETQLNRLLMQTGFSIPKFHALDQKNIEVFNIEYGLSVRAEKGVDPKKCAAVFGGIFDIQNRDRNSMVLNYKRVDNYKSMDSVNRTIHDGFRDGVSDRDIIDRLMQNHQFTEEDSKQKISQFLDGFNRIRNRFTNKGLNIVENPGFPARIEHIPFENQIIFTINNIISIHYIRYIQTYIDSILRITVFPDTIDIDLSKCNEKRAIEADVAEMVIRPIEKPAAAVPDEFAPESDEEQDADDFMFFSDDDDDDFDGGAVSGGAVSDDQDSTPIDGSHIDGLSLIRPNLFGERLKKYDPKLFLTRRQGKFKTYSRLCQFSEARQPVILTQEEKANIDKNHPGSYTHSIEYGSGDKKYHYICPRYWCLLTNSSMTKEEVESGKCGKVIPPDAESVPKGHYVYEFTHKKHVDAQGNYIHFSPGFIDGKTHPDGLPIPCCFKSWDPDAQELARKQITDGTQDIKSKPAASALQYIIGFDSFPIEDKRYGFLPPAVENLLHAKYANVVQPNNPSALKQNVNAILRIGTEQHSQRSIIGCLADIHAYIMKTPGKMSIVEFSKFIRDRIDLDTFISLNNGSLALQYNNKNWKGDMTQYEDTQFVKVNGSNKGTRDIIGGYELFKRHLVDPASTIDHVIMWDIIASTDKLFGMEINPVILELSNDDITNNVGVICPTTSYSSGSFNPNKPSMLLLKQDQYYELIGVIVTDEVNKRKRYHNMKLFYMDETILPELRDILNVITKTASSMCKPLPSKPDVYTFQPNIDAYNVVHKLRLSGYIPDSQVINHYGRVIAIIARRDEDETKGIYIPTRLSSTVELPMVTIDNDLWHDYEYTVKKLREVHNDTGLLCDPIVKIAEDNLVVGVLTQTNQFIQVTPIEITDDDLPVIVSANHLLVDQAFETDNHDPERIKIKNAISLETRFYNAYRNIVRMFLHHAENREHLDTIQKYVSDDRYLYKHKIIKVSGIISNIVDNHVQFAEYNANTINDIDEIYSCFENPESKGYCVFQNNIHKLMIPEKHLLSGNNNKETYALRIADELVRNQDFSQFILNDDDVIRLPENKYRIEDNEFILLQSNIQSQYMENLEPFSNTNYITLNTHDRAQPELTQYYSNTVTKLDIENDDEDICVEKIHPRVRNKWRPLFPENTKEIEFQNSTPCSYSAAQYIIQKGTNINMSINDIKKLLVKQYADVMKEKMKTLIQVWEKQGKSLQAQALNDGSTIEQVIESDNYFFSDIDAVMLFSNLKIGVVLYANTKLKTLPVKSRHVLIGNRPMKEKHYFMYTENKNEMSAYTLLRNPLLPTDIDENEVRISPESL